MWEKRATSAEGKTIRIAESSDMDSWEAVLRPCASFAKFWDLKIKWRCFTYATIPTGRYEVAGKEEDHDGLWSRSAEFCDLKVENVLCNYANGSAWGCWDWMTMKGYGRKRRSFGEINKMVIFRENVYKRDFLPSSTEIFFWEKVLKETSYTERFMGKVLKPSFLFQIRL